MEKHPLCSFLLHGELMGIVILLVTEQLFLISRSGGGLAFQTKGLQVCCHVCECAAIYF